MSPLHPARLLSTCALSGALVVALAAGPVGAQSPPMKTPSWKQIEQLVKDQKYQEAQDGAKARLNTVRGTANEAEWTRALIEVVQLEVALHGYETAVRMLKEGAWPQGALQRATLDLLYAAVLDAYAGAYGWEINQREQVASSTQVDLKAWTMDQLRAEQSRAYGDVWALRAQLGDRPIDALKPYLAPNDYPKGIRDTLRDAVSYLWVEMLGNTAGWRPEHANQVYQLDFAKLVSGDPAASGQVSLSDPAVHPLLKMGAILDDLESWHRSRGQKQAALEARLERSRRLFTSFTRADQHTALREELSQTLASNRDVPWFSAGMATLARFWMQDGNLVKAHQLGQEGAAAYPGSAGGKMCLALFREIEAPDFQLQSMSTDGVGKRSLELTHKNVPAIFFRAYALDLDGRLKTAKDYNLLPNETDFEKLVREKPGAEWHVELPATPDFQRHVTFVTPPMTGPGLYAVLASASRSWDVKESRVAGLNLILGDLVVGTHEDRQGRVEATVSAGDSGRPVEGATVELWRYDYQHGHSRVDTQTADAHGTATFAYTAQRQYNSFFVVARKGRQLALYTSGVSFGRWNPPARAPAALVFTDRSIYRPQQKILWKVVAYEPKDDAHYQTMQGRSVTVSLFDANSQVVETKEVQTNAFGSAAGEFTVPAGRLLGAWHLQTTPQGAAYLRVEEYKRPTFEVTLEDPGTALRMNKPASLAGKAKYYFGLPVTNGKVRWRATRQPVYPWWWFYWFTGNAQSEVVASGTAALGDDGGFQVAFTPQADEKQAHARDLTYAYHLEADVTDEGGETRSASRTYRLGFVSVEARVAMDEGFFLEKAPIQIAVQRTNLDGAPRPGAGNWRVLPLTQPAKAVPPADLPTPKPPPQPESKDAPPAVRTPGDRLRPRWAPQYDPSAAMADWSDGAAVAQGTLQHGTDGAAKASLSGLPAGAYRLRYETVDDFGEKYETFKDFVVAGRRTPLALPAVLIAQKSGVKVGDTARFLATSGLRSQGLVLDVYRDGIRTDRRYLAAGDDSALVEIPVREQDRGGFTVVLTALRDFQLMRFETSVFVPWDDRELKVSFSTFRDKIRPGAKETWRVTVKSETGRDPAPGAAEVLAYMFDQSLDLFGPHRPPSVAALYPNHSGSDTFRTSLGAQWGSVLAPSRFPAIPTAPSLTGDRVAFFDGYPIGGPGLRYRHSFAVMGGAARMGPGAVPPPAPAPMAMAEGIAGKKEAQHELAREEANAPAQPPAEAGSPAVELRSNFAETAFWRPQLLTGADGSAAIEFTVPDSVTSWNVWAHAITRDLRGGSVEQHTRSVKDLMVRPYLPRFLREGDQSAIKVVVDDASDRPLSGQLTFDIVDPETNQSVLGEFQLRGPARRAFAVEAGKGTDLTFEITAPKRVGQVAFKVVATAGDASDGELRPLPLLPSRLHLAQSRFVTLHDKDSRTMSFPDLARNDDSTRINEQLVVTLDAQLFYTVLQALPYLTRYPYECAEQTLNRFLSTGIVSTLYKDYPAVERMAQKMSKRDTLLETWDAADPNRKMALEETPWVQQSRGGGSADGAIDMLDSRITRAERDSALAKLRKSQTSSGGFPWFPGGPPSPYMTLYVMQGFARAAEFGIDVPKDVTQRGWQYLAQHFRSEYATCLAKDTCSWEFLTFLDYAATAYPDASYTGDALTLAERKAILDGTFRHWRQHSPYLKGYLALTLSRMGRRDDAQLVWSSVMDSAKTTQDEGTFWAREDRSWLWYNDTIETQAFALRTLMELSPQDARRHGLVQWLLINKKLNHWKSTRATAEVLYALTKYLQKEGALGVREDAQVSVGARNASFTFDPDEYTGKKNQLVVPGPEVDGKRDANVVIAKSSKGFLFASATWNFSTDKLPEEARGDFFEVTRAYFRREKQGRETVLVPLGQGQAISVGDEVEVQLSLRTKHEAEYVHLRDPRAAGLEPENAVSRYNWEGGVGWYEEIRDSGTNFFFEQLPVGQYTLKYRVRANVAGMFRVGPATVQPMYAPEFNAYSAGNVLGVAAAR